MVTCSGSQRVCLNGRSEGYFLAFGYRFSLMQMWDTQVFSPSCLLCSCFLALRGEACPQAGQRKDYARRFHCGSPPALNCRGRLLVKPPLTRSSSWEKRQRKKDALSVWALTLLSWTTQRICMVACNCSIAVASKNTKEWIHKVEGVRTVSIPLFLVKTSSRSTKMLAVLVVPQDQMSMFTYSYLLDIRCLLF